MPLTASSAPSASRSAARWMASGQMTLAASVIWPRAPEASSSRTPRPAGRAGIGLRVEAAIAGVVVLAPAGRAHLEPGHRRGRAVVGDAAHDREARAAVGAVDERVAEAAVGRVAQLGQAVVAGRGVRRDERVGVAVRFALDDAEVALAGRLRARRSRRSRRRPAAAIRAPAGPGSSRRRRVARRPRARPRARR